MSHFFEAHRFVPRSPHLIVNPYSAQRIRSSITVLFLGCSLTSMLEGCAHENQLRPASAVSKKQVIQPKKTAMPQIPNIPENGEQDTSAPVNADRLEITQIEGDPNIGTVINIQQIHSTPGMDPAGLEKVGEIQYRILQELLRIKPKHIFSEGSTEDFACDNEPFRILLESNTEMKTMVCTVGEGGDGTTMGEVRARNRPIEELRDGDDCERSNYAEYMEQLGSNGAVSTYVCLEPGVLSHQIYPKDHPRFSRVNSLLQKVPRTAKEDAALDRLIDAATAEVEDVITKKITDFLSHHPGETVVLNYGGAHTFKDNFSALERPPVLMLITFPELMKNNFRWFTGKELSDECMIAQDAENCRD